ncbi:XRE family transcriptional regulator [Moorellaceae bacterium AZ2]
MPKKKPEHVALGKRIREAREEAGLSRADLAGAANISEYQLQKYELGYYAPPYEVLVRIARVLNRDLSWFLGESNVPDTTKDLEEIVNEVLSKPLHAVLRWKRVPLVERVVPGPNLLAVENVVDYINVPEYREADFAVTVPAVDAAAMYPALREGDILICKRVSAPVNGDMVVLYPSRLAKNALVRYFVRSQGIPALKAMDPTVDDVLLPEPSSVIAGTVVYVISKNVSYTGLMSPASEQDIQTSIGISKADLEDSMVKEAVRLVGRASRTLSEADKEVMLKLMKGWLEALEEKQKKEGGDED